jgi:hypothetical protein
MYYFLFDGAVILNIVGVFFIAFVIEGKDI